MSAVSSATTCVEENAELAKWTFLRYWVLGMILFFRVRKIKVTADRLDNPSKHHPYSEHAKLTQRMQQSKFPMSWFIAGCMFVQSEGVGLTIYFAVSAMMDNATIFLFSSTRFCETVTAVSLYTMSLVTFLPNVLLGVSLQDKCYNQALSCTKALFVVGMAFITAISFEVRLTLVYSAGYAGLVSQILASFPHRVALAVIVPPLVDGIQSIVLLKVGTPHESPLPVEPREPLIVEEPDSPNFGDSPASSPANGGQFEQPTECNDDQPFFNSIVYRILSLFHPNTSHSDDPVDRALCSCVVS